MFASFASIVMFDDDRLQRLPPDTLAQVVHRAAMQLRCHDADVIPPHPSSEQVPELLGLAIDLRNLARQRP